jgi:hypothetical protein
MASSTKAFIYECNKKKSKIVMGIGGNKNNPSIM